MEIDGKIAFVTGGGSGLGKATAQRLAGLGAKVAILDFDEEHGAAVAADLDGHFVMTDVSDETAVDAALNSVIDAFGAAPRILVNCAGIGTAARIVGREGKLSTDMFERTIRVNLLGTYIVMSHAARAMQSLEVANEDGERGVVINTASVAFEDGQLGQSAYAASKGAIASMCLPAARELAKTGIRVMTIAPGLFQTPMMAGLPPEVSEQITANIPFPARLGKAEEYARLAEHIITNPFLNGTTIRLDGAVRLPPR